MIKVMIVDDEVLVRVGLKSVIDWQEYGFMVVGEAGNGRDALAKIREGNVDIVLLDIKMPVMDGIELLQIIHAEKLLVKVIILSCHDDFDYVKESMKLGASDYILKLSLDTDKLIKILEDLKNEISSTQSPKPESSENDILQKYCVSILERYDLDSWVAMKRLGMRLHEEKIAVFCIGIDWYENQFISGIIKNPELSGRYVVNTVSDIINNYANGECFEKSSGEYVALINPRTSEIKYVMDIAAHIKDALKRYSQFSVSIGISTICDTISQISQGYLQAKKALEMRFIQGNGSICFSHNDQTIESLAKEKVLFTEELEQRLKHGLEYHDLSYTMCIINDYYESIRNKPYLTKEVVMNSIDDIMMTFAKELRIYNKQIDDIEEYSGMDLKTYFRKYDYLEELIQWLNTFIAAFFDFLFGLHTHHKRRTEILKAVQYIEENYTKDISLAELARHVNLSESYLSYLFKKETGGGIVNYVSNLRLEMGKKLLKSTNLSVCEIAEKIGYSNVYYFSGAFKKNFGISPTEYQKMVNKS